MPPEHCHSCLQKKNKSYSVDEINLIWTELVQHTSSVCQFTGRLKEGEAIHIHADMLDVVSTKDPSGFLKLMLLRQAAPWWSESAEAVSPVSLSHVTSLVPLNAVVLSLKPFCSACTNFHPLHCLVASFPSCVILERSSPLPSVITFSQWVKMLLQGIDRQHNHTSLSSRGNKDKNPPERAKRRQITWFKKPLNIHRLKCGLSRTSPGNALPHKQVEEHPCIADTVITQGWTYRYCMDRYVICTSASNNLQKKRALELFIT